MLRTGAQTWSAPQLLSAHGSADSEPLAGLPDGGALVTYADGRTIVVRRAAPDTAFGPAVRLARVPHQWLDSRHVAVVSARGDALVVWAEGSYEDGQRLYGCEAPSVTIA